MVASGKNLQFSVTSLVQTFLPKDYQAISFDFSTITAIYSLNIFADNLNRS
jgi:hypothetical protein